MYTNFSAAGQASFVFAENSPIPFGDGPSWNLVDTSHADILGFTGSSEILIPVGTHTILIDASLNLDCRGFGTCDFTNTGRFKFGAPPSGLTWTSESGVFLSASSVSPVPEPATAATFGVAVIAGWMVRRLRR
jgi:hypothetical protein